jgi:endonuclease/exonuclease/phosphatase family metal-dependent hydrolase
MKKLLLLLIFFMALLHGYSQGKNLITVASYNIRYDNPRDGDNVWSNRKEPLKALIQFHDFDIFGTQEAMIGQIEGIAELQQYAWYGKGRDDGQHAGEHCAIFYKKDRFKLLDSGDFWLSETPDKPTIGWDSRVNKRVCSWGKFRDMKAKKEFYFLSVHFDNLGAVARRESAKLMVSKIKEIAGDKPVICVGDLNSTPETEQVQKMLTILRDSREISELPPYGPVGTTNSFKFDAPMKNRIDYIFVSKQIAVQKYGALNDSYDQKYPSDHLPIVAKIVIH